MCRDPYEPKFVPAEGMSIEARRVLAGYCDATGLVKNRTAAGIDAFVRMCSRLNESRPEDRLRASVEAECPGVERLVVKFRRDASGRSVGGAVAVGRGVGRSEIAQRIAETHGVALPDSAVEVIDPETWKLLQRLRDMGVIAFCGEDVKDVVVRDAPDAAAMEVAKRRKAAEKADAEVQRLMDMGTLLVNGGFPEEGQLSLRKAVALAAATARYALGAVPVEREITPVTIDELVVVEGELDLPQEYEQVLQLAVQGRDIPRPLDSVRTLVEQCRVTWK